MRQPQHLPQRRPTRVRDYDYATPGSYFVTICTHQRAHLFGEIADGEMRYSRAGEAVAAAWRALPRRIDYVQVELFVVMPNHTHTIITIALDEDDPGAGIRYPSLSKIIRAFKSQSAREVNRTLGRNGQPVWQRGFHDRIIRDDPEHERIWDYIEANPLNWAYDRENSNRIASGAPGT